MADWDLDTPSPKKAGGPERRPDDAPDGGSGSTPNGVSTGPEVSARSSGGAVPGGKTPVGGAPGGASPAARSAKREWSKLLRWIVAGLALVLVGALVGFFIARSQLESDSAELVAVRDELALVERALAQSEERNWMYYRDIGVLEARLEEAESGGTVSTSTTVPGSGSAQTYADGVYSVSVDISPGIYDGVVSGEVGYWARLKGTDGIVSSIITNGLPRGPFVLTIIESDKAVELRGVVITAR